MRRRMNVLVEVKLPRDTFALILIRSLTHPMRRHYFMMFILAEDHFQGLGFMFYPT